MTSRLWRQWEVQIFKVSVFESLLLGSLREITKLSTGETEQWTVGDYCLVGHELVCSLANIYLHADKYGVIFRESNLRSDGYEHFTYFEKKKIHNFSSSTNIVVVTIFRIFICIVPWRNEQIIKYRILIGKLRRKKLTLGNLHTYVGKFLYYYQLSFICGFD